MDNTCISVKDLINSDLAIWPDQGEILFKEIKDSLDNNNSVVISFDGIRSTTVSFFSHAIGQLLYFFDYDKVNEMLIFNDMSRDYAVLLGCVMSNAKKYFESRNIKE